MILARFWTWTSVQPVGASWGLGRFWSWTNDSGAVATTAVSAAWLVLYRRRWWDD